MVWMAPSKVVRQQSAPPRAETDPPLSAPFSSIMKIRSAVEVGWFQSRRDLASEIGMQPQDRVHIEHVGSDQEFLARITSSLLEPFDVLVPGHIRIFAVGALAGPVGDPVGSPGKKL